MDYRTILIDPPWEVNLAPQLKKHKSAKSLPYPTMTDTEIASLPIAELADADCHLWLWTTNQKLPIGFNLIQQWGFKYMTPIHWIKPSGLGLWWVSRSQTLLFAYRGKCLFNERCKPNVIFASPVRHSAKPDKVYELIEQVSFPPYCELFARNTRPNWTSLGNELDGMDIRTAMLK